MRLTVCPAATWASLATLDRLELARRRWPAFVEVGNHDPRPPAVGPRATRCAAAAARARICGSSDRFIVVSSWDP